MRHFRRRYLMRRAVCQRQLSFLLVFLSLVADTIAGSYHGKAETEDADIRWPTSATLHPIQLTPQQQHDFLKLCCCCGVN